MNKAENMQRVIALLDREEVDYLDKIGKDALFANGIKLSRIKILRAMVDAIRELKIDGKKITSEEDLKREILRQVSAYKEGFLK